ncbi:LysR family transcriptional regulator [Parasphingopyxis algicola]|uniref:LysR family transcriptional regulator n=1 Tax=Parasphingopyxis algicola TaxID=2026624 RepID=UPI0015A25F64|nr:LysR family transcriptional regulator [Parasphingopyxis algicola]QLC26193.1 LysR family transcriptional regulator [Parasphingopyxis algicola]
MPNLPDLEAWAIFAKVVELRSFTAAAEDLGLSKATVSKAVTRLETSLGVQLLHRSSRRLSLTESGRELAGRAQQLLSLGEEAEDAARDDAANPRGLVRLAAPMSFGIAHVGPALPDFLARYPDIAIDLHLADEAVDIIAGGFDAALRIGALPDSSLKARRLGPVERHLVAAQTYVERKGRPRHPADLKDHDCLCYAYLPNPESWRFTHENGEEAQVRPSGPLRANNSDAMMPALRAGLGIALVPDFMLAQHGGTKGLVTLLPDWSPPPVALHLVTPPGRERPARVTALVDFLAERFARLCAETAGSARETG